MKETQDQRNQRLQDSGACGQAILALIKEFGSSIVVAEKIGVTGSTFSMWASKGKISMRGATLLAEALGRRREEFRPDLSAEQWNRAFPGPAPGKPAEQSSDDAKLLASAAEKFGGTVALCASLGVTIQLYHCWKTRGKIPARRLAEVKELAAR